MSTHSEELAVGSFESNKGVAFSSQSSSTQRQWPAEVAVAGAGGLVGESEAVQALRRIMRRVAPTRSTVLIEGESGVGKELTARVLHRWSGRRGLFVPINCAACTPDLLESELFGHVRGAFTGAREPRDGLFVHARGGTLFLDEISEMPLSLQAHLLRVLEERTVRPVGSNREFAVDVRILAATNRNLADAVAAGRFREDLYYRLDVLTLRVPSLRERREDVPLLMDYFLSLLARDLDIAPPVVGEADLLRLMDYRWPGNVRELRNVIERCLLLGVPPGQCMARRDEVVDDEAEDMTLAAVERRHILSILALEKGNKSAAARRLGIARKTLERKLKSWRRNGHGVSLA